MVPSRTFSSLDLLLCILGLVFWGCGGAERPLAFGVRGVQQQHAWRVVRARRALGCGRRGGSTCPSRLPITTFGAGFEGADCPNEDEHAGTILKSVPVFENNELQEVSNADAEDKPTVTEGTVFAVPVTITAPDEDEENLSELHLTVKTIYKEARATRYSIIDTQQEKETIDLIYTCHKHPDVNSYITTNLLRLLAYRNFSWWRLSREVKLMMLDIYMASSHDCTIASLTGCMWSFGRLGVPWRTLDLNVQQEMLARIKTFCGSMNGQDISTVLYALATMGAWWVEIPIDLQDTILHAAGGKRNSMSSKQLTMVIWALGKLGATWNILTPGVRDIVLDKMWRCEDLSLQGVTNAVMGISMLRAKIQDVDNAFLARTYQAIDGYRTEMDVFHLSCMLYGWASLGVQWEELPSRTQKQIFQILPRITGKCVSSTIRNVMCALPAMGMTWESLPLDIRTALQISIEQKSRTPKWEFLPLRKKHRHFFTIHQYVSTLKGAAELGLFFNSMPVTLQANLLIFVPRWQGLMELWEVFDVIDALRSSGLVWDTIPNKLTKSLLLSLENSSRPRYLDVSKILSTMKLVGMPASVLPPKIIEWMEDAADYKIDWSTLTAADVTLLPSHSEARTHAHLIHTMNDTNVGGWFVSGHDFDYPLSM